MKDIVIREYSNATKAILHNRRVLVGQHPKQEDNIILQFQFLTDDSSVSALHEYQRGIKKTTITISKDAAKALFACLYNQLHPTT